MIRLWRHNDARALGIVLEVREAGVSDGITIAWS
jgi:hypothetical protein